MSTIIAGAQRPDLAALLEADLAYHMGERDIYDLHAIEAATSKRPAPDDLFVSFQTDRRVFFCGDFYKENCRLTDCAIVCGLPATVGKQNRQMIVINRDLPLMDPALAYAFDMRDAREHDYAAVFGTQRPIPVFQYHRRKGLNAIIHPLQGFQTYPSRRIPKLEDKTAFAGKRAKVFWRGKLSGNVVTPAGTMGIIRTLDDKNVSDADKLALLQQSARFVVCRNNIHSETIDAGLTLMEASKRHAAGSPLLEPLYRARVSVEEQLQYRYLLALDGYDSPSSWYWMLNTNSLVMRQESPWQAFGDNFFEPWVHFVPIAQDGSDVSEKFLWCERHLAECARIVANARAAWSVLFDAGYQLERRRAVMERYRAWMTA